MFAPFFDWGVPTVDCLRAVCHACPDRLVIASGGVRHGLDAAKAIRLGADMVAAAGPMLAHLVADDAALDTVEITGFCLRLETADGIDIIFDWGVKSGGIQAGEICCDGR